MIRFLALLYDTLRDLARSAGVHGLLRLPFWLLTVLPAAVFTFRMRRLDELVGRFSTRFAARRALRWFYAGVELVTPLPDCSRGGLVVSNHPGLGDSLALLAVLPEGRYRLVARDRLFFQALPHIRRLLILVPPEPRRRVQTVAEVLEAIRQGLLVVLYPAGEIEPDPAHAPPNRPLLQPWSSLVNLVARRLGEGRIYPVMVGNVFAKSALQSWWATRGKTPEERERRAVGYQLLRGLARRQPVRLAFGPPLRGDELVGGGGAWSATQRIQSICEELGKLLY